MTTEIGSITSCTCTTGFVLPGVCLSVCWQLHVKLPIAVHFVYTLLPFLICKTVCLSRFSIKGYLTWLHLHLDLGFFEEFLNIARWGIFSQFSLSLQKKTIGYSWKRYQRYNFCQRIPVKFWIMACHTDLEFSVLDVPWRRSALPECSCFWYFNPS